MRKRIGFLCLFFMAWLPVFVLQKPAFLFYHRDLAAGSRVWEWLQVMGHGLKLDCTLAGYLTVLPLLLTAVSLWKPGRWLRQVLKVYVAVAALLVAAIFAVDEALYGYWRFRLDATLFFYLQSPREALASVPWPAFLSQTLVFLLYAWGIGYFFRRCVLRFVPEEPVRRPALATALWIPLAGLLFIPIRGGVTTSTANVGMVYFSANTFLNHAAINPAFSLFASLSKQQDFARQFDFFPEEQRAAIAETLLPKENDSAPALSLLKTARPNILIILLESFSANVVGALGGEPDATPCLDRLAEEGVLFTRCYANSFRTDRGIVSVLNGYWAQPTTSIMKYPAKSQTLPSIAKSLVAEGYRTDMLYGGDINFTNMQSYFFSSGYQRITADRDFPLTDRLSKWGANDDVTFSRLYDMLQARAGSDQPWMTTFLTLSSHEPFEVPFHRYEHPYVNSVAFTDSCLGHFVDRLKQTDVWDNLLLVLVADHGFLYPETLKMYEPRRQHIPMIWAGGAVKEAMRVDRLSCQTDLAATLLAQLGLSHREFRFSKDLFDPTTPGYAFYTFSNGFGFIDPTGVSAFDNAASLPLLADPEEGHALRLEKGKALLQTLYDDLGSR
ncbi:MAG: LTA synthase family protein [Parabacteroides sp.]